MPPCRVPAPACPTAHLWHGDKSQIHCASHFARGLPERAARNVAPEVLPTPAVGAGAWRSAFNFGRRVPGARDGPARQTTAPPRARPVPDLIDEGYSASRSFDMVHERVLRDLTDAERKSLYEAAENHTVAATKTADFTLSPNAYRSERG